MQKEDAAAEQQRVDEAKSQENDAKKAAAQATKAQPFVDKVDPQARIAKNALTDLNTIGGNIAAAGAVTAVSSVRLTDIKLALGVYKSVVSDAPDQLTAPTGQLKDSIDGFVRAVSTLLSAEGARARESLDRFRQVYDGSKDRYNRSLSTIYGGTSVQPPLL